MALLLSLKNLCAHGVKYLRKEILEKAHRSKIHIGRKSNWVGMVLSISWGNSCIVWCLLAKPSKTSLAENLGEIYSQFSYQVIPQGFQYNEKKIFACFFIFKNGHLQIQIHLIIKRKVTWNPYIFPLLTQIPEVISCI